MALSLAPVHLPLSPGSWQGLQLMAHQAEAIARRAEPRLLIEAPTGGGKTWTGALPLLEDAPRGEGAVFVYPTNALADDQIESLVAMTRASGRKIAAVRPDGSLDGDSGADVMVWRLHSGELDAAESALGGRTRGATLGRVLERLPAKPLWLVTNPDTAYLLMTARFSNAAQHWSRLELCRSLIMDEFHLYRGPTLVRAVVLIELAVAILGIGKVRVLSATLSDGTRRMFEQRLGFGRISVEPSAEGRVVQHEIRFETQTGDATRGMVERTMSWLPGLRAEARAPVGTPLVVLKQSVLAATHLEDSLVESGVDRDEIGVYRGLSSRAIRSMDGKALVIGTSALEVGVDFRTPRLIFEATTSTAFAQRLGRVARHEPGLALFFTDPRVASLVERLGSNASRLDLDRAIRDALPSDDDLAGFALSPWGNLLAGAVLDSLLARGKALGGGAKFEGSIEAARARLAGLFSGAEAAKVDSKILEQFKKNACFRNAHGSVEVFDVREKERRGSADLASFDVDLPTFFRRANWAADADTNARPVVLAWTKPKKLHLALTSRTAGLGLNAPRPEQIELRIDGAATAWEVLLTQQPHVVGLFPKELRAQLSWREVIFESADGQIALLDDDALVGQFLSKGTQPS